MPDTSVIRPLSSRRRSLQRLGQFLLRVIGWRVEGDLPDVPKFVLIVHPHTSNWDLPIGLICAHAIGLLAGWPYGFMVKDTALGWPVVGPLVRWLGGIGIDRTSRYNAVEQMVAVFSRQDRLMLAITPEGTRRRTGYWKSGFYYIALGARVPIVLAFIDYKRRTAGLGPVIVPSDDVEADLARMRAFYAGVTPRYPEQAGEIRFKPDAPAASPESELQRTT
jgi:1-acyl-sn-glycerol-3-phosphate acyltransferase